jgi:hypothetical protein
MNIQTFLNTLYSHARDIWQSNDPIEYFIATAVYSNDRIQKLVIYHGKKEIDLLPFIRWFGWSLSPEFRRVVRMHNTVEKADRGSLSNGFTQVLTKVVGSDDPLYKRGKSVTHTLTEKDKKDMKDYGASNSDIASIVEQSKQRIIVTGSINFPNATRSYIPQVHEHSKLMIGSLRIKTEQLPEKILVLKTQKPVTYIAICGVE